MNKGVKQDWRSVPGYEGLYQVNSDGVVYSFLSRGYLKPSSEEYLRVTLSKKGKSKKTMVHLIVADAFILNPDNLPVVNHINGNKHDPRVINLVRVTYQENSLHARDMGLCTNTKLDMDSAEKIRYDYQLGIYTQRELAEFWGVSCATISKVIRGESWRTV